MKELTQLNPPEKVRIYVFNDDSFLRIENVTHLEVSASGNHRAKTSQGKLYIVKPDWRYIEIEAEEFTF